MKKNILYLFIAVGMLLVGCEKDMELTNSTYIDDAEYPSLPAYSEWGYNTFGAYFDREVFRSNDKLVPLKVIIRNDTTSFLFKGQKGAESYNTYTYKYEPVEMSIEISFSELLIEELGDLLILNDTIIELNPSKCKVIIRIASDIYKGELLNGTINFKKSRQLIVDEKLFGIILSGYFDFHVLAYGEPIAVSAGRFDMSINNSNFFSY